MNKSFPLIILCIFIFSACSTKELVATKYFPNSTKDNVLLAGKNAFLIDDKYKYIIDSYRDRLEVTAIDVMFYTLQHKDYLFTTQEDECGTKASLSIHRSFGLEKKITFDYMVPRDQSFWDNVQIFLKDNEELKNKDMSQCIIKNEFNLGVQKETLDKNDGNYNEKL